uniref:Uncharacterized protein n=1 Tax=Spermophilus dauricus TaxID=99837 RepID=A0A8C9PWJ1_SPEDA
MDWKEVLRRRLATPNTDPNNQKSEQELKDEEMDLFTKYYSEWKGGRKNTNELHKTIPRFYYRVTLEAEPGGLQIQSQSQELGDTKQLSETLSLNKIQNRARDVAQWLSVPEFNPTTCQKRI